LEIWDPKKGSGNQGRMCEAGASGGASILRNGKGVSMRGERRGDLRKEEML
jgi:hypothetical protein